MSTQISKWLLAGAILVCSSATGAADLTVSAASSLTNAFKEMAQVFETQQPGVKVLLNFGASGALLQQLARGAPVDVFASADLESMDQAQQQTLVVGDRHTFARNQLVVVVPADSPLIIRKLEDLGQATVKRIAAGNPASVPVGRYTKHALDALKLGPMVEGKMVGSQSVRQVLDYVARGEVDAGFVYATDAAIMKDKVKVAFDVALDIPISYPIARIAASANRETAEKFIGFVLSPPGQAILAKYGFLKP